MLTVFAGVFLLMPKSFIETKNVVQEVCLMKNRSVQIHLQALLEDFHGITQIGIAYLPMQPTQDIAGILHFSAHSRAMNTFLSQLQQVPDLMEQMKQQEANVIAKASRQQESICSFEPFPGLKTYVFPVYSRGVLLGCFLFGPIRVQEPARPYNQGQRANLYSLHHLDEKLMTELYDQLPLLDKPAVIAASRLLSQIAVYASNVDSITAHSLPLSVRIVEYIDNQYMNAISPSTACAHFHISRSTLSRTLSKEHGSTFLAMLNRRRINNVCKCIEDGMSPEEASSLSGFSSPLYMARVFRTMMGCTPHAYRQSVAETKPLSRDDDHSIKEER
jgi:AraC-like DNA-binding protein